MQTKRECGILMPLASLPGLGEEIHKGIRLFAKTADPARAGQAGKRHQDAAPAFCLHQKFRSHP